VRELSVGTIEWHLRHIAGKHGPAMAKMTKSVLGGVCGLAARHDALERNPVRDTGSIQTSAKKAPKALTPDEARTLLAELDADGSALNGPLKVTRCSLHGMAEVARYPSAAGAWRAGQPGRVGDGGAVTVRVDADDA
jgi:hypothetical protein